jgi:uncharacterized repeat protein (TIGR03803 family)
MMTQLLPSRTSTNLLTRTRARRSLCQALLEALEPRTLLAATPYNYLQWHWFTGGDDGRYPGDLVIDADGNLFGTTGDHNGSIYEIPNGDLAPTPLYSFTGHSDGRFPDNLVVDSSGNLFGTTSDGGAFGHGTLFEIPAGETAPVTLWSFHGWDGDAPSALLLDSQHNLIGATTYGGDYGRGTLFEISSQGHFSSLHSFRGYFDGEEPGCLVTDSQGNIFGTTFYGGDRDGGTVFQLDADNYYHLSTLHSFDYASELMNTLAVDPWGNLFGATGYGGYYQQGTIFEIAADTNDYSILHTFSGDDGGFPLALTVDADGNLFGASGGPLYGSYHHPHYGPATIFEISVDNTFDTLYTFHYDQGRPQNLILDADGNLFGTTDSGGPANRGTLFELTTTPPAVTATQLVFTEQPADAYTGRNAPPITVNLMSADDQTDLFASAFVTLHIVSGPAGATIRGTTSVAAQNGVATFDNLRFSKPGTYTLSATAPGLASTTSDTFTVRLPPTHLRFTQRPTPTVAGQPTSLVVYVADAKGNPVTNDNSLVTLTARYRGITTTFTAQAQNGVATFDNLVLNTAGTYSLTATDDRLAYARVSLQVLPDAASAHLVLVSQPTAVISLGRYLTPAPQVVVEDQFHNRIPANRSLVTLSITSGPAGAALTGTLTRALRSAYATFTGIKLTQPGDYTLQLLAPDLPDHTPVTFFQTIL